jgi:hypothetical protein
MSKFINKILYEHLLNERYDEFEKLLLECDETDIDLSLIVMRFYEKRGLYRDVIRLYQKLSITRYQHFALLIESSIKLDEVLTFDLFVRYCKLYESSKIIELIEMLIEHSILFRKLLDTVLNESVHFKKRHSFRIGEQKRMYIRDMREYEKRFDTYPDYSSVVGLSDCVIVDCANVFYSSGGPTSVGFKYLQKVILSIEKRVILVIHKKYVKLFNTYITPPQNSVLFQTPYGENDDNYIILLSLYTDSIIVSNDKFRDHIANMNNDLFTELITNYVKTHSKPIEYDVKRPEVVRFDGLHYYVPIRQSPVSLFYII